MCKETSLQVVSLFLDSWVAFYAIISHLADGQQSIVYKYGF